MNRRALLKSVMAAARVGMAESVDASAQPRPKRPARARHRNPRWNGVVLARVGNRQTGSLRSQLGGERGPVAVPDDSSVGQGLTHCLR